jgi:hypothetical protein
MVFSGSAVADAAMVHGTDSDCDDLEAAVGSVLKRLLCHVEREIDEGSTVPGRAQIEMLGNQGDAASGCRLYIIPAFGGISRKWNAAGRPRHFGLT